MIMQKKVLSAILLFSLMALNSVTEAKRINKRPSRQISKLPSDITREIHRVACAVTSYDFMSKSFPLRLNCQDTYQFNGEIAVTRVIYTRTSSCLVPPSNYTCYHDLKTDGLPASFSKPILDGNGLGYHEVTVEPYFSGKCLATSSHVVVYYTCRDRRQRFNMCESFSKWSYTGVDITTPHYPERIYEPGTASYLACLCTAFVPDYAYMIFTTYDLDFYEGIGGLCNGEEFFTGDYYGYRLDELFAVIRLGQHPCSYDFSHTGNFTDRSRTLSMVYYQSPVYQLNEFIQPITTRGAWLRIQGIASSTGQPVLVNVTCSQIFDPNDGSGSGDITSSSYVTSPETHRSTDETSYSPSSIAYSSTRLPSSSTNSSVEKIKPKGNGDNATGVIVGVSIAGLVVLAVFAVVVFMCLRRRSLNDVPDTDTKGTISPRKPTLPPRNIGMQPSVKSSTSIHEYFEPLEEDIYCIPADGPTETGQYETLQGMTNMAMDYTVPTAPTCSSTTSGKQPEAYAVLQPTAPTARDEQPYLEPCVSRPSSSTQQNKRQLDTELSNAYDSVPAVPDYENTKSQLEAKNSEHKYFNLTDCVSEPNPC